MIEETDVRCDRKTCFALNVSFWTTCLTETRSTLVYRKRFRNLNGSQNLLAKIGTERILVSFYTWKVRQLRIIIRTWLITRLKYTYVFVYVSCS